MTNVWLAVGQLRRVDCMCEGVFWQLEVIVLHACAMVSAHAPAARVLHQGSFVTCQPGSSVFAQWGLAVAVLQESATEFDVRSYVTWYVPSGCCEWGWMVHAHQGSWRHLKCNCTCGDTDHVVAAA